MSGNDSSTDLDDGDVNEHQHEGEEETSMLRLKPNTARQYGQCMAYFTVWCYEHRRELIVPELRTKMETSGGSVNTVRKYCPLLLDGAPPLLDLKKIQVDDFINWFDSIIKNSEERVTQSQFARHRKAFRALFACQGIKLSKKFSTELSQKITLFLKRNGYHYLPHLLPRGDPEHDSLPEKRESPRKAVKRPRRTSKPRRSYVDDDDDDDDELDESSVTEEDFDDDRESAAVTPPAEKRRSKEVLSQAETLNVTENIYPLKWQSYTRLCNLLFEMGPEGIVAHTGLVLAWNLPCKLNYLNNITLRNISWEKDLIIITMDDGMGHIRRRCLCPNPLNPALCPILALTIYMCVRDSMPSSESGQELFPPSMESIILAQIRSPSIVSTMMQEGLQDPCRVNAVSCVGGVSLLCYERGTNAKIENAIKSRLDGSREYNTTDDMLAARILAGLPLDSSVIDGPHFNLVRAAQDDDVVSALRDSFKWLPESHKGLRFLMLACLIYHSGYIEATMGPIFVNKIPVLLNREKLEVLRSKIICSAQKDQEKKQMNGFVLLMPSDRRSAAAAASGRPSPAAVFSPKKDGTVGCSTEWVNSMQSNVHALLQKALVSVNEQTTIRFMQLNEQLLSATENCRSGSVQGCLQGWKQIRTIFDSLRLLNQSALSEVENVLEQQMLEYILSVKNNQTRDQVTPPKTEESSTNQTKTV